MKSKKPLLILILITLFASGLAYWLYPTRSLTQKNLTTEWIENHFPEKLDEDAILPFGYTLGPWPLEFQGDPIVTKLTYQKGPPLKFIQTLTQIWKPIEIEVTLSGPKTLNPKLDALAWKKCFQGALSCRSDKNEYLNYVYPEQNEHQQDQVSLVWFDSLDPLGARGTHLVVKTPTYQIDRYTFITPKGSLQSFSLKAVLTPAGEDARALFLKTMGSLKVKDDLESGRAWIQNKIKQVSLEQAQKITDPKLRLTRLIQIQNWIYSLLSVDPSQVAPFFHLAGVTHLLAMELLKTDQKYFDGQEAWMVSFKPLFETLLRYSKDFPNADAESKNIEALLQDVLYQQSKMSH